MPRVLKDIRISEVSAVDKGAGENVKIVLMKRDDDAIKTVADLEKALAAFPKAADQTVAKATIIAKARALNAIDKLPVEWGITKSTEIEMDKAELDKIISEAVTKGVAEATKPLTERIEKQDRELRIVKMSDTHKAYMGACSEETAKAFADLKDDKERDDFMDKNPIKKRADPVTVDDISKRDGVVAELRKQVEDQGRVIAQITTEKRLVEFNKSAGELGATEPGDGALMMKAYSGDAVAQEAWTKRLAQVNKALTEQVRVGKLFSEFGTAVAKTGKAYDQIVAKATELRKTETKLTEQQAFAKVYTDPANRELVQQYKQESGAPA